MFLGFGIYVTYFCHEMYPTVNICLCVWERYSLVKKEVKCPLDHHINVFSPSYHQRQYVCCVYESYLNKHIYKNIFFTQKLIMACVYTLILYCHDNLVLSISNIVGRRNSDTRQTRTVMSTLDQLRHVRNIFACLLSHFLHATLFIWRRAVRTLKGNI